jgi:hypothetical protein
MPTWTRLRVAWLRLLPLAEAADAYLNRATDFATEVIKAAADKAQERRKSRRLLVAIPVEPLPLGPAVPPDATAPPVPPRTVTRVLFEQANDENASLTRENGRLREEKDKLKADLEAARGQAAPRRSVTRLLFGEASDENLKLRQERDALVKERDHLRGENQALRGRLSQLTGADEGEARHRLPAKVEVRLKEVFAFFLPNVVLVDGTIGFVLAEIDYPHRVLALLHQLNSDPGSVRGTRITNGWLEFKFGKGSLYGVRVYFRHDGGTGKCEVLVSGKQLQERDFEKLARK